MHKIHKNHHFTSQFCHCERREAIHKTQNPHVISRLTGNPGNKDFNTFWMPDRVGHDSGVVSQSGRSMVEMLGTLAIIGVLSAGVIGGYSYAMNKHRTNELIYEATKQAQWAGTQMEMNRSVTPTLTGGTFGGGTIETTVAPGLPATQVGIQLTNLNESVCESLSRIVEDNPNGVVRAVQADCNAKTATLVFNRDLSTTDSQDSGESGNESGNEEPEVIDCGAHGTWGGSSCTCDKGWGGADCTTEVTDPDTYENQPCDDNDDCGPNGTYFCKYTSVNCTTGPTAQGKCTKTSTIRGSGGGYVWSTTGMDWFSAENFCDANGKDMVELSDFNCPYSDSAYVSAGCGYCCAMQNASIDTDCNGSLSSGITDMRSAGVPYENWQTYWTKTLINGPNSCAAFNVDLTNGYVSGGAFRDGDGGYALCR